MNLEAIYPNDNDPYEEMGFEELRAKSRGWLHRDWAAESKQRDGGETQGKTIDTSILLAVTETQANVETVQDVQPQAGSQDSTTNMLDTTIAVDIGRSGKGGRAKKMKIKEIKRETQTSMY